MAWGGEGRKGGGRCFSSTSLPRLSPTRSFGIIATTENGFTVTSNVELRLRFEKQSNDAKARGLSWYNFCDWIRRYNIMGFMILHGKHARYTQYGYVREKIRRQILPWKGTWCWSLLHDMKTNITIGIPPCHYYISKSETKITWSKNKFYMKTQILKLVNY